MDVQILEMDHNEARRKYLEYRTQVRKNREKRAAALAKEASAAGKELHRVRVAKTQLEKEDEIMKDVYRSFANGQRILNVSDVLRRAPLTDKERLPTLAIARADWTVCHFEVGWQSVVFADGPWTSRSSNSGTYTPKTIRFGHDGWNPQLVSTGARNQLAQNLGRQLTRSAKAMVPSIPVHLRPADNLSNYHILWEAEWQPVPPVDPILLKHIAGDMFVVVAQWDLTEIERSVLAGRFS